MSNTAAARKYPSDRRIKAARLLVEIDRRLGQATPEPVVKDAQAPTRMERIQQPA